MFFSRTNHITLIFIRKWAHVFLFALTARKLGVKVQIQYCSKFTSGDRNMFLVSFTLIFYFTVPLKNDAEFWKFPQVPFRSRLGYEAHSHTHKHTHRCVIIVSNIKFHVISIAKSNVLGCESAMMWYSPLPLRWAHQAREARTCLGSLVGIRTGTN